MVEGGEDANNSDKLDTRLEDSGSSNSDLFGVKWCDLTTVDFESSIEVERWAFDDISQRVRKVREGGSLDYVSEHCRNTPTRLEGQLWRNATDSLGVWAA